MFQVFSNPEDRDQKEDQCSCRHPEEGNVHSMDQGSVSVCSCIRRQSPDPWNEHFLPLDGGRSIDPPSDLYLRGSKKPGTKRKTLLKKYPVKIQAEKPVSHGIFSVFHRRIFFQSAELFQAFWILLFQPPLQDLLLLFQMLPDIGMLF